MMSLLKQPQLSLPSLDEWVDRRFDIFDDLYNDMHSFVQKITTPYNTILVDDNTYRIELALAGYKKEHINVYIDKGYLYVDIDPTPPDAPHTDTDESEGAQTTDTVQLKSKFDVKKYPHYIHKGITTKYLKYKFGIPKNVQKVNATFTNGILTVDINTDIPKEPERIAITVK